MEPEGVTPAPEPVPVRVHVRVVDGGYLVLLLDGSRVAESPAFNTEAEALSWAMERRFEVLKETATLPTAPLAIPAGPTPTPGRTILRSGFVGDGRLECDGIQHYFVREQYELFHCPREVVRGHCKCAKSPFPPLRNVYASKEALAAGIREAAAKREEESQLKG